MKRHGALSLTGREDLFRSAPVPMAIAVVLAEMDALGAPGVPLATPRAPDIWWEQAGAAPLGAVTGARR